MNEEFSDALHEGENLVVLSQRQELPPVGFREREVSMVIDHLDRKRSVLIVGANGVGKTAVVHGVAHAFAAREKSLVRKLSTAQMMTGTKGSACDRLANCLGLADVLAIRAVPMRIGISERVSRTERHRFLTGASLKQRNPRETLNAIVARSR